MKIEFNAKVLTKAFWPEFHSPNIVEHEELKEVASIFYNFYKNKYHAARELTLVWTEGYIEMSARFDKTYQLQVTYIQMMLLFQLDSRGSMKIMDIMTRIFINFEGLDDHSKRLLQKKFIDDLIPLLQKKLLKKLTETKKIDKDDLFSIDETFKNAQLRIVCFNKKNVQPDKNENRKNTEQESLEKERDNYIDAAIVRIMKARKTIRINDLFDEVVRQITLFTPQPMKMRNRIESLSEGDYMKRSEEDIHLYIYLP